MLFERRDKKNILEDLNRRMAQLEEQVKNNTSVSDEVKDLAQQMNKQINRHDMALENMIDEIEEDRENNQSLKVMESEKKELEDKFLGLFDSYQDVLWQIKRFAGQKDESWNAQFELLEHTLDNAKALCGITEICERGIAVDYRLHDVVDMINSDTQDKVVADIYSPGYFYKGRVIKKAVISAYKITKEETF